MVLTVHSEKPPLKQDADGALRVGDSRVLLEMVIRAFQDGATPEAIAQKFPSLTLPAVYSTIAYYLRHQGEVDLYLREREQQAAAVKQQVEGQQKDLSHIRARLMGRRQG